MYKIDPKKCTQCGNCVSACANEAIVQDEKGNFKIDPEKCTECGACQSVCESDAIKEE